MRHIVSALCLFGLLGTHTVASAQNQGFQLNRYEPTTAGESSFWVDHPWYSSTRYFAAGVTLNYGHNPLVFGLTKPDGSYTVTDWVVTHQLIGHIDLAGSFLDRVNISASLPIAFLESGSPSPYGGVAPMNGVGVGDPRLGLFVRLFGQPDRSPISLSIGGQVWVPLRGFTNSLAPTVSDQSVRVLPKLVLAGYGHHIRWSFTGGFLYRPEAHLGNIGPEGSTAGSELQFGAGISYADQERRFAIGPEAVLATLLIPNNAFQRDATSLEVLLGAHYNVKSQVQLGVAGGFGVLRQPGTPDFRLLFRVAYAPIKKLVSDRDRDGIPDNDDACLDEPGARTGNPRTNGCPSDRDGDGVPDRDDLCADTPQGDHPDPQKKGCPLPSDRDGDGVPNDEDQCPGMPQGAHPDPQKKGCPVGDKDSDRVYDFEDLCPETPQGAHPDPQKKGCPAGDRDHDGFFDDEDQCPDVLAGFTPDPQKKGCPAGDHDQDTVSDTNDACPDQPGAPSLDPKKHGCPGMVIIKDGRITISQPVFFATNKDTILKKSFPLIDALVDALKATPQIKKVVIEGHSDNRGKREYNITLSERRAKSVLQSLAQNGVAEVRLEAKGFGPDVPIADNKTAKGRATNRRVDFVITDPPQPQSAGTKPAPVEAPEVIDQDPDRKHRRHRKTTGADGKGAKAASDQASAVGEGGTPDSKPAKGKQAKLEQSATARKDKATTKKGKATEAQTTKNE